MKWMVGAMSLAIGCTAADSADRDGAGSTPRTVVVDSLTVTDSIGLAVGGSKRIRIAYWAQDRMVYCAMATLASVSGSEAPVITEERSCENVDLLAVDSVRFRDGIVTTPAGLKEHTVLRVEAKP